MKVLYKIDANPCSDYKCVYMGGEEREGEKEKGTYVCISRKRKTEKELSRRILTKNGDGSHL